VFDAQVALEAGQIEKAGMTAYQSMVHAAKALVKINRQSISDNPDEIIGEFRTQFYDTQKFWDPYAGGKFANYLFEAQQKSGQVYTADSSRYLIDEAQLFIDAAHACYNKIGTAVGV
jgi:sulfite reductase (ferredoxin)